MQKRTEDISNHTNRINATMLNIELYVEKLENRLFNILGSKKGFGPLSLKMLQLSEQKVNWKTANRLLYLTDKKINIIQSGDYEMNVLRSSPFYLSKAETLKRLKIPLDSMGNDPNRPFKFVFKPQLKQVKLELLQS